ncbi:MAG: hypothetical protein ACLUZ4_02990 [Christensenellaceae bacterium]
MVEAFKDVVANITPVIENIITALPAVTGAFISTMADDAATVLMHGIRITITKDGANQ